VGRGGTGTTTSFTQGSVVYAGASGVYSQDNSNLFWDGTNHRLGLGTASPNVGLDVAGTIVSRVNNAGASTSIDWSSSNVAYTSASCGSFTFTNMQDGGSYTLVIQGTTSGTCSFSQSGLTFKLPVGHGATTAAKQTVYSFMRAGTTVYATWIPGY
jgi:hypothetical protein